MDVLRKFLFGQGGGFRLKPLCQQCVQNSGSIADGLGISGSVQKLFYEKLSNRVKLTTKNMCRHLDILSELFSKQCNLVLAQRIRRSYQILLLYRNLYGEHLLKEKVSSHFNRVKKKPLVALLSAAAFSWEKERISDDEIKNCHREVVEVKSLLKKSKFYKDHPDLAPENPDWETIVDKVDFKVWRYKIPNTTLFKYRVLGHFKDIPARAFYNTQVDVHYWKDWDNQTIDVSIIDRDAKTGSEVIHWLYRFPYPMNPREYVYVRRCTIFPEKNAMIITARATKHPTCPYRSKNVRVETYMSQMVITPYTFFDEDGFSYIMSYCDDPQTNFPPVWYNWMASAGVHEFLERMHRAALKKHEKGSVENATNVMDSGAQTRLYPGMVH